MSVSLSSSTGAPPFSSFAASAPSTPVGGHPAPGLPPAAPVYASDPPPASFSAALLVLDPFSDPEDHLPEDDHPFIDPSAPPLSLDSSRAKYHPMVEYILGSFPQSVGAPTATPPPRALFESFFTSASPSPQSLSFNWFDRFRTALVDADSRMAAFLAAGRSDRSFLAPRHTSYAVWGEHALGRAVPVNESLLAHFERQLRPNPLVGLSVKDAMSLEASFRAQSEALSYSMWVLSGLLGFVRLQGFSPADSSLFNQLVTSLLKSIAHQASVAVSHTAYICHKRRELYLSHLLAYFSDVTKRSMLELPVVFADSLFREEDVARFLDATSSSSSLRSQQALVDVATWDPFSSSARQRRFSPHRSPNRSSPARRRRRESGSPLKLPRKSHFRH